MLEAIRCSVLRGGTSKGLYFLKDDLPSDTAARDRLLLAAMGSPDTRQIDGMGGAHPLTSKVAIVSRSQREGIDVDYLFLQVSVEKAEVSDAQNCGNILAGVGPFAIEAGLVAAGESYTDVSVYMVNSGATAVTRVQTPEGRVSYQGRARIDGVPGTAAPVLIDFQDIAGSNCGALLPTGNAVDDIEGVQVTCIDNGMPVVILNAADFGLLGGESPGELEANDALKQRIEAIRLVAGRRMNLGDVTSKTVPKMTLVSAPVSGGTINTRTFIPHRVHEAIGVLGSVSVATACVLSGSVAQRLMAEAPGSGSCRIDVEHPTGVFTVEMEVASSESAAGLEVRRAALLRTARLLMRGEVMVPDTLEVG